MAKAHDPEPATDSRRQSGWINARIDADLLRQVEIAALVSGLNKSEALKEALTMWVKTATAESTTMATLRAALATTNPETRRETVQAAFEALTERLRRALDVADEIQESLDVWRGELEPLENERRELELELQELDARRKELEEALDTLEEQVEGYDTAAGEEEDRLLEARAKAAFIEFDMEKLAVQVRQLGIEDWQPRVSREARDALDVLLKSDEDE
jgi:chromosome segregation ATPase